MSQHHARHGLLRTRWAAIGAAVAVSLGAGGMGIGIGHATTSSGERPIYLPIEPCRLADTRPVFNVGPRATPLGAAETYDIAGWGNVGNCNLPTNTAGLALNVTAIDPSAPTFLTLFPDGTTLPLASHLNPTPGQPPTPNAVNVDLSAAGNFSIYNLAGNVHVAIDVVGIYDDHNHNDIYYTEDEVDAVTDVLDTRVTDLEAAVAPLVNSVAAFAGGDSLTAILDGTDLTVQSVSLMPPADGIVVVNSSANVEQTGGVASFIRCSITTGTTLDFDAQETEEVDVGLVGQLSGTRGFDVTSGVLLTVNYVCDSFAGTANLRDAALTAIFAPT